MILRAEQWDGKYMEIMRRLQQSKGTSVGTGTCMYIGIR